MQTEFTSTQYEVYPDGVHRHFWMQARHDIIARRLKKIGGNDSILDIGCGRGVTVSALRQKGFNVFGCELGKPKPYTSEIKPYLFLGTDFKVLEAEFRQSITIVLLLDVLEHIENPQEFLRGLRSSFPHINTVIVTVPARKELWTNYDEFYGHLARFSEKSLRNLVEPLNFKVKELRYIFQGLYFPLWVQAKFGGKRSLQPQSGKVSNFHTLISWFFRIEDFILPSWVPGSSIFAVLKIG